jgi:hypothetical protein
MYYPARSPTTSITWAQVGQVEKLRWVEHIEVMAARPLPGCLRQEMPMYIAARADRIRRNDLTTITLTQHWRSGTAKRRRNNPCGRWNGEHAGTADSRAEACCSGPCIGDGGQLRSTFMCSDGYCCSTFNNYSAPERLGSIHRLGFL